MPAKCPPEAQKAKVNAGKLAMTCSKPKKAKMKMMKMIAATFPASSFIRMLTNTAVFTTILANIASTKIWIVDFSNFAVIEVSIKLSAVSP